MPSKLGRGHHRGASGDIQSVFVPPKGKTVCTTEDLIHALELGFIFDPEGRLQTAQFKSCCSDGARIIPRPY